MYNSGMYNAGQTIATASVTINTGDNPEIIVFYEILIKLELRSVTLLRLLNVFVF